MVSESPSDDRQVESSPVRLTQFDEAPGSALTPMGQVDSIGSFARGLGARRLKLALAVGGGFLLLLALLSALQ